MVTNMVTLEDDVNRTVKTLPNYNYLLGRGLTQPFNPANSGSRKLMYSVHREHGMVPSKGEVPLVGTGYENEYGKHSSSFIMADSDYEVVAKIPKFEFKPDHHYFIIIRDIHTGTYDYIERVSYNHNAESYGYLHNNKTIDSYKIGTIIKKDSVIRTSNGFDKYGNKMDGVNLVTMYLSCNQNQEDSMILTETGARKMASNLVHNTDFPINENDILLNWYGNDTTHKSFPDIGENIKDGIFCGIRRLENDTALYMLSRARLKDIMMSDKVITMEGRVADIEVNCNNPAVLSESPYNQQVNFYYNEGLKFAKTLTDVVGPLAINGKLSYKLEVLYSTNRDILDGKKFIKDKEFNNVIMKVVVVQELHCEEGDKICDRYGGKGIISQIIPDYLAPRLDNGVVVDIIKNSSTCMGRENLGQLDELSINFIGARFIDYFNTGLLSYAEFGELLFELFMEIEPDMASFLSHLLKPNRADDLKAYIDSIVARGGINTSLEPFTTNINIDKLRDLYKRFPWIRPYKVTVPQEGSNGEIRYIQTRRDLVVAKIYNHRLKQYAEEKFSVTSLSATNMKNLNTKSKASKMFESRFKKTPIMFGGMEAGDLAAHLGIRNTIIQLMLYAVSPKARRLFEQLLVGDPYDIDIKLDKDSKNRNAEIIATIFKAMGLRLEFIKKPKKDNFLARRVMVKPVKNQGFDLRTNIRDYIGDDNLDNLRYRNAKLNGGTNIANRVMCKKVDKE